jgi:hypothetical protein
LMNRPAWSTHPTRASTRLQIERMALAQARFLQTYPNPNR